jgi:thiol-disulfide isomerase/thioredoxin
MRLNTIYGIGLALVLGSWGCNGEKKKFGSYEDSDVAKIKLKDLNGEPIRMEKYEGKAIFINFWATWCKPCIQEMPSIWKLKSILKDEMVFLMASAEDTEEIEWFRKAHDYKLDFLQIQNMESLNIQALPTTFIFDPQGKLIFSEMGYRKWDDESNINMIRKIALQND